MPTIAELIAAKKAAAAQAESPAPAPQSPLGKPRTAGLVLTKDMPKGMENGEPRGQRTPIAETLPNQMEKRSLSEADGEAIPLTPTNASAAVSMWHEAMNAFQSDLCLMRDPNNPEYAWFAVRLDHLPSDPILLHRLPLYEHPRTVRAENEPF
jgi:hypothetical protein